MGDPPKALLAILAAVIFAAVAIATHSFTDFNLHIPANALLFAVISAITYAALFNVSERNGVRGE